MKSLLTAIIGAAALGLGACANPDGNDSFRESVRDRNVQDDKYEPSGNGNPEVEGIVSGDTVIK
jgi:hypothetical protein